MPRFLGGETCMQIEDCVGGQIRANHDQLDGLANQIASMLLQVVNLATGVENNSQTASNNTRTIGKLLEQVANQSTMINDLLAAKPSGEDFIKNMLLGVILVACLAVLLLQVLIYFKKDGDPSEEKTRWQCQ